MHTPRMNFRQSMSLNEAVMEAMTGRMSDSKIKADLENITKKAQEAGVSIEGTGDALEVKTKDEVSGSC